MMNKNNRSQRLLELLEANRKKHKPTYGALYDECVCVLGAETKELSPGRGSEIYKLLNDSYPFEWWGRINWNMVVLKHAIDSMDQYLILSHWKVKSISYRVLGLLPFSMQIQTIYYVILTMLRRLVATLIFFVQIILL